MFHFLDVICGCIGLCFFFFVASVVSPPTMSVSKAEAGCKPWDPRVDHLPRF